MQLPSWIIPTYHRLRKRGERRKLGLAKLSDQIIVQQALMHHLQRLEGFVEINPASQTCAENQPLNSFSCGICSFASCRVPIDPTPWHTPRTLPYSKGRSRSSLRVDGM